MFLPQIKADSIAVLTGVRATSMLVACPTIKLAELRTHRLFVQTDDVMGVGSNDVELSINANSSRAIPADKVAEMVRTNPYQPHWTAEQSGMSGGDTTDDQFYSANDAWKDYQFHSLSTYERLKSLGIHKQNTNLALHPFARSIVILTGDAGAWDNWFNLRLSDGVYPDIRHLARQMKAAYDNSLPVKLHPGQWHLPFADQHPGDCNWNVYRHTPPIDHIWVSASCCARISFANEREETLSKHIERANRCIALKHNVFEHQLKSPTREDLQHMGLDYYEFNPNEFMARPGKYLSNIKGWVQARKMIENNELGNF